MRLMRKAYRNLLLELIKSEGLEPRLFKPTEEDSKGGELFSLELSNTPLCFIVEATFNGVTYFNYECSTFAVDYPQPNFIKNDGLFRTIHFSTIETAFKGWLASIKKYFKYQAELEEEQAIPDLWAEFHGAPGSNSNIETLQNTQFSSAEQNGFLKH